jgi:galactokinase
MNELVHKLHTTYQTLFEHQPLLICSPGRVNLIGEHTDYNEGFVLPAAIDKAIYLAVGIRQDQQLHFVAHDLNETYQGSLLDIRPTNSWADYLLGVLDQLQLADWPLRGINCVFGGTIPIGAGLSSSAALENGIGYALNELLTLNLDRIDLVRLSQQAENEFVGAKVGIMDMFASMMGRANHVIKLDCRSLNYAYAPFQMEGIRIVLCDSRVKHSLVHSEYNTRRAECEAGVLVLQSIYPAITSLRDVTKSMLNFHLRNEDPLLYRRCSYVIDENERVLRGVKSLEAGDMIGFGQLMYRSHDGLSKAYEVSCDELDLLVNLSKQHPGVLGARMMGGGFGGCTINLVKEEHQLTFSEYMYEQYTKQTGMHPLIHICTIQQGTHAINAGNTIFLER